MFKKNISILTSRDLSGKDVKSLKKDIKLNFPDLTDEQVSDLVPNKAEVSLLKLSNRAQAYTCNGKNPLFFDPEGRGDLLVPSVYVLWKYPHILSSLTTYSEVSPKGLIVPEGGLGTFSAGDRRTVVCPGNKFPFAVGLLEVSSEQVAKTGLAGRGLKLLHHYPDQLWGLGDKVTPDKSFTPTRVFPQATASESDRKAPSSQNAASTNGSAITARAQAPAAKAEALALSDDDDDDDDDEDSSEEDESAPSTSAAAASPAAGPPQTPDSIIESCLMTGLHLVPDNELPMLTSTFSAKYMMQGRPADTAVDIKRTSYKKLSKLLSTFEKKGLLQVKLVHKQDHLSTVNRQHALYSASAGASEAAKEAASAAEPSAAEARQGAASTSLGTVDIAACYRVPSSLRPVFGSNLQPPDHLYSAEDVAAALREYAHQNSLSGASEAEIKLDRFLVAYVFNKKDPQQEGDAHAFDDLLQRLLHKLTLYNRVTRSTPQGNMETVQKGAIKSIAVAMEDRQGGRKHITRVAHCESFSIDPAELAGLLQRKFKTSASVQKLPGKQETGKEIALQGDLLHDIPKFLTETYGLSLQYIDIKSKGK